jgi:hypothetical protein
MSTNADLWTSAVSHSTIASFMHAFREVTKQSASSSRRTPSLTIHREMLEIFQVDNNGTADTTQA